MTKKSTMICAIVLGLIAIGAVGGVSIAADDLDNYPQIVQKLADRFGVDESEVQKVFTEFREEHQNQMKANFYQRVNELANSGKITAQQKQLIIDKFEQLQKDWQSFRELPPQERQAKKQERRQLLQSKRTELEDWAKKYNIDLSLITPMLGKKMLGNGKHRADCVNYCAIK